MNVKNIHLRESPLTQHLLSRLHHPSVKARMNQKNWEVAIFMSVLPHTLLLVLMAISASSAQGQTRVTVADQDFKDADWTTTILIDKGGTSTTITTNQRLTGGNPGSYRRISHEGDPGNETQEILVVHLHREAIYNPRTSGAVTDISYDYDLRVINSFPV